MIFYPTARAPKLFAPPVSAGEIRSLLDTVREMRSAVALSRQFHTPVADQQLILDWADQLEAVLRRVQHEET